MVGCGTGSLTRAVPARFPPADVSGINLSSAYVEIARSWHAPTPAIASADKGAYQQVKEIGPSAVKGA